MNNLSLSQSWRIQRRVIGALLMREVLTRYGRDNIGFLWLFLEPMLFTTGVTALWSMTKALHGADMPITAFALTGYSSVLLWRNMPSRCIGSVGPNLSLMYHRNVRVMDVFAARLILEVAGAATSFIVLGFIFVTIGWCDPPENPLEILFAYFMLAWFGAALAIFLGALSVESELVEKLWFPFQYLLFPLSGAAFMVDALPTSGQKYILFLPMVHGVEILREGFFGSRIRAHYDMSYMAMWCVGLSLLAVAKLRKVSREIVPE